MKKSNPTKTLVKARGAFPRNVIVIVGPTASGKSDLAIKIAKKFNGEIISADSRQVYRGMDVGTGKVARDKTEKSQKTRLYLFHDRIRNPIMKKLNSEYYSGGIRHHLIDVASPKRTFTAAQFKKLGERAIKEILAKNKIPIIIGGTGFYIDALLNRVSIAEVPPDKKLRKKLGNLEIEKLFEKLKKLDPERAKTIEPKNKRRLIRALEIVLTTGKPVPQITSGSSLEAIRYNILWLGLNPGKEKLAVKIKKRLDARLKQGMVREVIRLRRQGISWKRLDSFGLEYRQISKCLKNIKPQEPKTKQISNPKILNSEFTNSEYYEKLLRETVKYSKRQMNWFKRNPGIRWIKGQKETEKLVSGFLNLSIS